MIENQLQYNLAKTEASRFEQTLTEMKALPANAVQSAGIHPLLRKAERDALQSQLDSLREEITEYEASQHEEAPHTERQSNMDEPVHSIQVCAGLVIEQPCAKLLKQLKWIWGIYDGVLIPHDSKIGLFEILLCNSLSARLDTSTKIGSIWYARDAIRATEKALSNIPPEASLTDETIPWDNLKLLFKHFCSIEEVGAVRATKILHKKRPALIPIFDENLKRFYWTHQFGNKQHPLLEQGPTEALLVANFGFFRECLLGCLKEVKLICGYVEAFGFPVTPVRALESLLWLDVGQHSESYLQQPPLTRRK